MASEKPLPAPDGDSAPFWEGAREGRLRIQRCAGCGRHVFYPRSVCPHCMSTQLEWVDACGRARVHSYTVVHRAPAAFAGEAPYVVALVDLEEGVRMMTRITGSAPDAVWVEMPVEVSFEQVSEEIWLPCFKPVVEAKG